MIEAPSPIHSSHYPVVRKRRREEMSHPVTLVDYVDHLHPIHEPAVEGLTSRSRIECGAVEIDPIRVLGAVYYRGFELAKVGVGMIESLRHWEPGTS